MIELKDLNSMSLHAGIGMRATIEFPNGYGASIITGLGSFTSTSTSYEVLVLEQGMVSYTTPITDDVLGSLTVEEVVDILKEIEALPTRSKKGVKPE